jgi:hypothetical protein
MSHGIDVLDNYRRAGDYVSQILKGAKVANLPFQEPTRLTLSINLSTARAIQTTAPPAPGRAYPLSGYSGLIVRAWSRSRWSDKYAISARIRRVAAISRLDFGSEMRE